MEENITIYKNTKRNEICPCGSGKIFKKCCMQEYREAKKQLSNGKVSPYSPLPPLTKDEQEGFTKFYTELLVYSHQQKNQTDIVEIESNQQNVQSFLENEREYFYKNSDDIISKYTLSKNPNKEEMLILEALKDAIFGNFFLLSKSEEYAVIMDLKGAIYNIRALNSPFTEIFNQNSKYLVLVTALIPYKDGYITDGLFQGTEVPKDIEKNLDTIPFSNPTINYGKSNNITGIQFAINFSLGCDVEKFEEMEQQIFKKVPSDFTKGLIELFDNEYSYKTNVFSSFIRTNDFLDMKDSKEGEQTLSYIFGGAPVINFERGNKEHYIPYDILEKYYTQPSIYKSVSYKAYKGAKGKNMPFSSFYTILGVTHMQRDNYDNFLEFIEIFKDKDMRKKLSLGMENLFDDFGCEIDTDIYPVFLDVCVELEDIYEQMDHYHDYMRSSFLPTIKNAQKYSINRGK